MAQTSKTIREAYNKRTYKEYKLRIRRNSELNEKIEQTIAAKGASLNYIITQALAAHYGVPMPDPQSEN